MTQRRPGPSSKSSSIKAPVKSIELTITISSADKATIKRLSEILQPGELVPEGYRVTIASTDSSKALEEARRVNGLLRMATSPRKTLSKVSKSDVN